MIEDWYLDAIDRVERSARSLHEAVARTTDALADARSDREARVPLPEILNRLVQRGGREIRLSPTLAFREFEEAVTAYRAVTIRALVDEQSMTFSQLAEITGVSRQMVARLYRAVAPEDGAGR